MKHKFELIAGCTALTLAAIAIGTNAFSGSGSEYFREERIHLPDVAMIDAASKAFQLRRDVEEEALVVINFSYTTCESICPLGNQILQFVDERRDEISRPVQLLTITIDPANDTPDIMGRTAKAFGASESWHWLTSSPGGIAEILDAADADVADIELHDPIFLVGEIHSGSFFRSLSMPDADEIMKMLDHFDA